jgi:organic hydroperoxide reductase OsmC/OhrA
MQAFPHYYAVTATAGAGSPVTVQSNGLPALQSAPPAEFGGPGNLWSPETLLIAAIADCYVLTFRAIANVSKLSWVSLTCEAIGTLDRVDRVTQFVDVQIRARLNVLPGADAEQARRLLVRAEEGCLITNSLKAVHHLDADVAIAA